MIVGRFITHWIVAALLLASAAAENVLPRVLILGDSIYNQPWREVAKELKGQAEVVHATMQPGEVRNTTEVLETIDTLLGKGGWALIHFNFGLSDLVYRAPGMKSFRTFPKESGGVRATSPEQYEKNLREIVKRLRASGAKLVWASTTPIRSDWNGIFDAGSEIEYNAIAARIMAENKIPVNDMHAFALASIKDGKETNPFAYNRVPLHTPIVEAIRSALSL